MSYSSYEFFPSTLPISLNRGLLTSWISIYIERSQTSLSIDATISIILLHGGRGIKFVKFHLHPLLHSNLTIKCKTSD